MRLSIDIVLPCYNPSGNWVAHVETVLYKLRSSRPDWDMRLIVVTDGSTQGHGRAERDAFEAAFPGCIYVAYEPNRGKGYALRAGIKCSTADYVLYTDWDFPFTMESYLAVLDALQAGATVVLAERIQESYRRKLNLMRRVLSTGSHIVNGLLLSLPSNDTQAGLKAFASVARPAFLATTIDRYLFDSEFICLATRRRLPITVVKAAIRPGIVLSKMTMRTLFRELRHVPSLVRARWFS